ncbi:MAG: YceI family protein [Bdellovibrionales bacterium]|nr:YceI family protein [Bdellovibrionales bacterium]
MRKFVTGWITGFALMAWAQGAESDGPSLKLNMMMTPGGAFEATSSEIKGTATVTKTGVTAKSIVLDLKTLDAGMSLRTKHMKDNYLEVAKFPTAEVIDVSGKDGKFEGKLKIRDKTVPIKGTYEVKGKVLIAKFPTTFKDCGIKSAKYKSVGVDDEVEIEAKVAVAP